MLGTGVNPGFVMDALPIVLTAVCERVDRVVVNRVQDARIAPAAVPAEDRRRADDRAVPEDRWPTAACGTSA